MYVIICIQNIILLKLCFFSNDLLGLSLHPMDPIDPPMTNDDNDTTDIQENIQEKGEN